MSNAFHSLMNAGVSLLETIAGDPFTFEGVRYQGNFRTGNSMEQAEAGSFTSHGGQVRTVVILEVARSQFANPLRAAEAKNKKLMRLTPTVAEYTVAAINTDDPTTYAFVLIGRG